MVYIIGIEKNYDGLLFVKINESESSTCLVWQTIGGAQAYLNLNPKELWNYAVYEIDAEFSVDTELSDFSIGINGDILTHVLLKTSSIVRKVSVHEELLHMAYQALKGIDGDACYDVLSADDRFKRIRAKTIPAIQEIYKVISNG